MKFNDVFVVDDDKIFHFIIKKLLLNNNINVIPNFFENGSAYNASKFGLVGFTQAVMLDLRKYGIKVTTIMPGSVATHFNNHVPNDADAWKIQPEDIGELVVDILQMNPRTLPSKIEVRPSMPGGK